jgi:oxygen-independent coproporphyrinogen-3 oxidase
VTPALPHGEPIPAAGPLSDRSPQALEQTLAKTSLSAYVHIPFCTTRCGYCDFNTYVASELDGVSQSGYVDVLLDEVQLAEDSLGGGHVLSTVFFGGGTPTLLAAADIARILAQLRDRFGLRSDAEVTIEANPESVNRELLAGLRQAGVNRISIGMQSAQPHVLAVLDRRHTPGNVAAAVKAARRVGFEQVSLDLIYGTPGESIRDWEQSLETAISLEPNHISAYALIVEPGTRLAGQVARGEMPAPDDDDQATKYELADAKLSATGFSWYEVSNWSRDIESQCRHNLAYWRGSNWWGFGPGAHSYIDNVRWWNVKHPRAYMERLNGGASPAAAREVLDAPTRHLEEVMLRARLREGLPVSRLSKPERAAGQELAADGLIDSERLAHDVVVLTERGRLLADLVVRRLTEPAPSQMQN